MHVAEHLLGRILPPDRKPGASPGLRSAYNVGCLQSKPEQRRRGEARLVTLGANQNHHATGTREGGIAVLTSGIEAPLEDVTRDDHRAGDLTVVVPLAFGPDIDEQRAALHRHLGLLGR
jgi:hypothetical protein